MTDSERLSEIEKTKKESDAAPETLGPFVDFEIVKINSEGRTREKKAVATEIPLSIITNDMKIATLFALPIHLKELTTGFLFTAGYINSIKELKSFALDTKKWIATVIVADLPDSDTIRKRVNTLGCAKGELHETMNELSLSRPISSNIKIKREKIIELAHWLQQTSPLFKRTGGVHNAALSMEGHIPESSFDDVGRHNAVDKAIGKGLIQGADLTKGILISSGRISSEILQKVKRAGISIMISRGAPTHQTILRAREMGITVVGFARGCEFNVYSHDYRIIV